MGDTNGGRGGGFAFKLDRQYRTTQGKCRAYQYLAGEACVSYRITDAQRQAVGLKFRDFPERLRHAIGAAEQAIRLSRLVTFQRMDPPIKFEPGAEDSVGTAANDAAEVARVCQEIVDAIQPENQRIGHTSNA